MANQADPAVPVSGPITVTRTRKVTHRQAALILAERDPVLARLVEEAGLPGSPRPPRATSPPWSGRSSTSSWPGPRPGPSTAG